MAMPETAARQRPKGGGVFVEPRSQTDRVRHGDARNRRPQPRRGDRPAAGAKTHIKRRQGQPMRAFGIELLQNR
tara:strand:+ start:212 stop:433 length:222 start_codon:yes stop_codon:yes gene_type:complete